LAGCTLSAGTHPTDRRGGRIALDWCFVLRRRDLREREANGKNEEEKTFHDFSI
jgi:hypothetical protein